MLWYVPLEPYKERYTGQLDQWMRAAMSKTEHNVVEGEDLLVKKANSITTGQVLDANTRVQWATTQVQKLVYAMATGTMKPYDNILLMDFWHPGLDGLFYALHQYGLTSVNVHAMCWAQSVDQYDFTHPMRGWMRQIEQGYGKRFSSVFVADQGLGELLETAGIAESRVFTVGLPFSSKAVWDRLVSPHYSFKDFPKNPKVVFTSRFDSEKDPLFFLEVAKRFRKRHPTAGVTFVMCSSSDFVRSNSSGIKESLIDAHKDGLVTIKTGLSKDRYYSELLVAKVQFNCAFQDWVSYTLLEAVTFGCFPVYPMRRSFPAALRHEPLFMYRPSDVDDAVDRIVWALADHNFSEEAIKLRQELILPEHDAAIAGILNQATGHGKPYHYAPYSVDDIKVRERWREWKKRYAGMIA